MSEVAKPDMVSEQELEMIRSLKPGLRDMPVSSAITHIMAHGSLQSFTHDAAVPVKLSAMEHRHSDALQNPRTKADMESLLTKMQAAAKYFFGRLDNSFHYSIDSSLMSYLTLPGQGKMYSTGSQPSDLPVSITFMGQFIDHDLTKNATTLIDPELNRIDDEASPYIDLDSVYGPRPDFHTGGGLPSPMKSDGRFELTKLDATNNAYDVMRKSDGTARIADGRNDENQLVLQVHILLMRIHNLLIKEKHLDAQQARRETIFNWQSVVLNSHQASVLKADTLHEVMEDLAAEVANPGHGPARLKYRPSGPHKKLKLPHEFAIGFRYGHSQLRNEYTVAPGRTFKLFDNFLVGPDYADLRGKRPLKAERAIDWPFFITPDHEFKKSNRLDTLITSAVFNLPETAVPDNPTNFLGNLPQRNLIRSHEIRLTSGERLFDFYFGADAEGKLTPDQIEPNKAYQGLFSLQSHAGFQTPLWYYLLKEAELEGGLRLGKLGSRLVGEVVGGAIYYNPVSYVRQPEWKSAINNSRVVTIKDLVDFVQDKDAT